MKQRRRSSLRPFLYAIGTVFAAVVLLFFLLGLLLPDRSFSEKENRVLTSLPPLSAEALAGGSWQSQFETYVNDQFPFRDLWISMKAGVDRLLGKVENNRVFLGKHGYLIQAFDPPSQEHLNEKARALVRFGRDHPDLNKYMLLAPNAVSTLASYLPANAPTGSQDSYLDALAASLAEGSYSFIDIRQTLSEHRDTDLYYHTDHHWTTDAAWFAFNAAAKEMGLDPGAFQYEKMAVTTDFQGTLSAKSGFLGSKKDRIDVYLPSDSEQLSLISYVDEQVKTVSFYELDHLATRDKYAMFLDGNHAQVKIQSPVEETKCLLLIKDSYANCFVPFLAPYFQKIVMVDPRYYYGNIEQLMKVENVTDVLFLYNCNTFFEDSSLEMMLTGALSDSGESSSETESKEAAAPSAATFSLGSNLI